MTLIVRHTDQDRPGAGATLAILRRKADVIDTPIPWDLGIPGACCPHHGSVRVDTRGIGPRVDAASARLPDWLILEDTVNRDADGITIRIRDPQDMDGDTLMIRRPDGADIGSGNGPAEFIPLSFWYDASLTSQ